ncbi:MAG: dihydrofolate reductase family protein [Isosphaeraceae bacterium]
MRKIRIFAHVSLDGVISPGAPDENSEYAHGGWTAPYRNPTGAAAIAEAQGENFDLLLGRRTYDLWSGFWPKAPSSPIADRLNAATKYVATHHPQTLAWGPVADLGPNTLQGIRDLRDTDGPDLIAWGSTAVTSTLFEHDLVDEVVLCVYPVLLGLGKRFFADSINPRGLALVETKSTPTGVLIHRYQYLGAPSNQVLPK